MIDSAETLGAARIALQRHARAYTDIVLAEVKSRFVTQAVAREVQDEGTVKRLCPPTVTSTTGVHT